MARVDYSRVAGVYRWLERGVFGSRLQRARVSLLPAMLRFSPENRDMTILVVGDGDGRFLEALLRESPAVRVDYVDCSEGMMLEAQARVGLDTRVNWCCGDLREWERREYDAVVAHFLLDGFEGSERQAIVDSLVGNVAPDGCLLVSDFDPQAKVWGGVMVRLMQLFFALFGSLPIVEVSRDDGAFLDSAGVLITEKSWQNGWIYAQLWKM